ncbi:MAG: DUF1571 domain-containing protein [Planctomycetota bacterium]
MFVRSWLKRDRRVSGDLFAAVALCSLAVVLTAAACAADPVKTEAVVKDKTPPQTAVKEASPVTAATPATSATTTDPDAIPKPPIDEAHPLYLPLQEAYKAREALKAVKDYEAVFVKRELIGRRLQKSTMNLKLRVEPFSVYLKCIDANAGREVIYNEGRLNNQMQIHEAGIKSLAGTVLRTPNSPDVMAENRYPANMVGLKNMLDKVIKQWEEEGKFGEIKTQKYKEARLPTGEECITYESLHPTPRTQFKFHITRLWIDNKTGLAIRVEQLDFPRKGDKEPPVIEEYTYGSLKTNVKLTDYDFDVKNKAYKYQ